MDSVAGLASGGSIDGVIRIEDGKIRSHVDEEVRSTVEETLNALLEAEDDELCGAKRYARSAERLDTRAGHYDRQLHTQAGEETLHGPWRYGYSFGVARDFVNKSSIVHP